MTNIDTTAVLGAPIKLNTLSIHNRMVMGPMAANAPREDGGPSAQTTAFFEARARGGIGMIIAGGVIAATRGFDEAPFRPLLRFDIDDHIADFRKVADAVHAHDTPIVAEIMPGFGRMGVPGKNRPIISASPINVVIPEDRFPHGMKVPGGRTSPVPDVATIAEIQAYEAEMIEAAVRAQTAGWDGVEVAAHMSYFLASFLSPRTNWREDEYGGSVANRARVLVNIVDGIRKRLGNDYLVGLRITSGDGLADGQSAEDYAAVAREVQNAGADYVALSRGNYETMDISAPLVDGALTETGEAAAFRRALDVPILLQGYHDPAAAAQAISDGLGDMIMLARPLLADPNYALKVAEGRASAITVCTREHECMKRLVTNMPIRCTVNAEMGLEEGQKWSLSRAARAPMEKAVLGAMKSKTLMKAANKLTGAGTPKS